MASGKHKAPRTAAASDEEDAATAPFSGREAQSRAGVLRQLRASGAGPMHMITTKLQLRTRQHHCISKAQCWGDVQGGAAGQARKAYEGSAQAATCSTCIRCSSKLLWVTVLTHTQSALLARSLARACEALIHHQKKLDLTNFSVQSPDFA